MTWLNDLAKWLEPKWLEPKWLRPFAGPTCVPGRASTYLLDQGLRFAVGALLFHSKNLDVRQVGFKSRLRGPPIEIDVQIKRDTHEIHERRLNHQRILPPGHRCCGRGCRHLRKRYSSTGTIVKRNSKIICRALRKTCEY